MARGNKGLRFVTSGGRVCDSGFERSVLQSLEDRALPFEHEAHVLRFKTKVRSGECAKCGGTEAWQRRSYTPDARLANGLYVEIKGHLKPKNRAHYAAVLRDNPGVRIAFVWMRDNIYGTTRTRYSEWSRALGCLSAVGSVPDEWARMDIRSGAWPVPDQPKVRKKQCKNDPPSTSLPPTSAEPAKARATRTRTGLTSAGPKTEPTKRTRKARVAKSALVSGGKYE